jgi:hypothetical protein
MYRLRYFQHKFQQSVYYEYRFDVIDRQGVIVLTTSTPFPNYIIASQLRYIPPGLNVVLTETSVNGTCTTAQGSECVQKFTLNITALSACTLSGNYTFTFDFGCRDPLEPVCVVGGPVDVFAFVNSDNFCGSAYVNIGLNGTLTPYSTSSYTTVASSFLVGARQFYSAKVFSSQAAVTNVTITSIMLQTPVFTWSLLQNGTVTPHGVAALLSLVPGSSTYSNFSFNPFSLYNSTGSVTVYTTLSVTYQNGVKRTLEMVQEGVTGFQMTAPVQVVGPDGTTSAAASVAVNVGIVAIAAVLLALVNVVLV